MGRKTILFVFVIFIAGGQALEIGDECVDIEGNTGICTELKDCESVEGKLRRKEITFKEIVKCGLTRKGISICCPPNFDIRSNFLLETGERSEKFCGEVSKVNHTAIKRVVDGENVSTGEFPHVVAIGYRSDDQPEQIDYKCTGSLISAKFVLTAANCFFRYDGFVASTVKIGRTSLIEDVNDENPSIDIKIKNITVHPNFVKDSNYNDIALVELEKEVDYVTSISHVRPACLYYDEVDYNPVPNTIGIVGWGLDESENASSWLKFDHVKEISFVNCSTNAVSSQFSPKGLMCAISDEDRDEIVCNGINGGPLHELTYKGAARNKIFYVKGLAALDSKICGKENNPRVNTRVSEFVDWIENIVWPEKS